MWRTGASAPSGRTATPGCGLRTREAGDHADAEPGGDERLDRDVVVGDEADPRREAGPPAGVEDDPVPRGAGRPGDPWLVGQVGEPERAAPAREPMAGGEDGLEGIVEQRDPLEVARRDLGQRLVVVVDQREVELARLDPGEQPRQALVDDGQRDLGVAAAELHERRRHDRRERRAHAAEAQPAVAAAGDLLELLLGAVEAGEDPGGVARQRVAGLGQLDGARPALDERQADLPLERGDVLAHRRLREPHRHGRAGERAARSDLGEHAEAAHVDHQCDL